MFVSVKHQLGQKDFAACVRALSGLMGGKPGGKMFKIQ